MRSAAVPRFRYLGDDSIKIRAALRVCINSKVSAQPPGIP